MSAPIVQPSTFRIANVSLSQVKVNPKTQSKSAFLNYGDRPLVFQTPSLQSPFGVNINDQDGGMPKYSLNLALRGYQEAGKVKAFYDALQTLDKFMLDQAVKNSKLWFKSDMSREVLSALYSPCAKFGKDKEGNQTPYPPNIKVNFRRDRDSGKFECDFYDQKSRGDPNAKPLRDIPIEEMMPRRVEVTMLIQCTGVWFAGGKFGLAWKALQTRLDSVPAGISGYGFAADDDEEDAPAAVASGRSAFSEPAEFAAPAQRPALADESDEESEEETAPAPPAKAAAAPAVVDSDEEDEEAEVGPPPVPKKPTVTKKKIVTAAGKK